MPRWSSRRSRCIHHARKVAAYLDKHPRLELLYGTRYSPHDNPAERIWED
jgi:transposase